MKKKAPLQKKINRRENLDEINRLLHHGTKREKERKIAEKGKKERKKKKARQKNRNKKGIRKENTEERKKEQ